MQDYYPPVAFNFSVNIAGDTGPVASFNEISGLNVERQTAEITEGGENRFVHKLPTATKHANLVLKRGIMPSSAALFSWCRTTLEADLTQRIETKDVLVSLLDQKQQPMISWTLSRAWPVKWQVASLRADDSSIAIETLELAYSDHSREISTPGRRAGFSPPLP